MELKDNAEIIGKESEIISKTNVKSVLSEFSDSTSFHGISKAFGNDRSIFVRLFWLSLILGGLVLVVINVNERVQFFLTSPTSMNVGVKYVDQMDFPSVIICNANAFRRTLAAENGHSNVINSMYGDSGKNISDLDSKITLYDLYTQNGHRKEDMIYSCRWQGNWCGPDYFDAVLTEFGLCYTFNGGNKTKKVSEAGIDQGLALVINVEQYDYMPGPHNGAGIKLQLYTDGQFPMPSEYATDLPTGRQGFVNIGITKESLLPHPYGVCSDDVVPIFHNYTYTKGSCLFQCKSDYIKSECGCSEYYVPNQKKKPAQGQNETEGYSSRACTVGDMYCTKKAKGDYVRLGYSSCSCPIFCQRTLYQPYISYGSISEYTASRLKTDDVLRWKVQEARQQYFIESDEHTRMYKGYEIIRTNATTDLKYLEKRWGMILESLDRYVYMILSKYIPRIGAMSSFVKTELLKNITNKYKENINSLSEPKDVSRLLNGFISSLKSKIAAEPMYNYTADLNNIKVGISDLDFRLNTAIANMKWLKSQEIKLLKAACPSRISEVNPNITRLVDVFLNNDRGCGVKATVDYPYSNESTIIIEFLNEKQQLVYNISSDIDIVDLDYISDVVKGIENHFDSYIIAFGNYHRQGLVDIYNENLNLLERFGETLKQSLSLSRVGVCARDNSELYTFSTVGTYFTILERDLEMYFNGSINMTTLSERVTSKDSEYYRNSLFWMVNNINDRRPDDRTRECALYLNSSMAILKEMFTIIPPFTQFDGGFTNLITYRFKDKNDDLKHIIGTRLDTKFYQTFFRFLKKASNFLWNTGETFYKSLSLNSEFYSKNFLHLNIYFHELSFQEFIQQEIYDIFGLLGDIGGAMGLFMGASLMSIFELWELIASIVNTYLKRNRNRTGNNDQISNSQIYLH